MTDKEMMTAEEIDAFHKRAGTTWVENPDFYAALTVVCDMARQSTTQRTDEIKAQVLRDLNAYVHRNDDAEEYQGQTWVWALIWDFCKKENIPFVENKQ